MKSEIPPKSIPANDILNSSLVEDFSVIAVTDPDFQSIVVQKENTKPATICEKESDHIKISEIVMINKSESSVSSENESN